MGEARVATRAPDRFLFSIVVGAVALVVVGIAVVLLAGRAPQPSRPDLTTPTGVVQAYVEALRAGETDRARSFLSQSAREQIEKIREPYPRYVELPNLERRILIEPIQVEAERAEVRVTISTFSASAAPFSSSTFHNEVTVRLVKESGAWRISQPFEPYPFL